MKSAQDFMWIAFGVASLLVALALAAVLIRVRGTLGSVEELLDTTNEELKETLPEVRQTIGRSFVRCWSVWRGRAMSSDSVN